VCTNTRPESESIKHEKKDRFENCHFAAQYLPE